MASFPNPPDSVSTPPLTENSPQPARVGREDPLWTGWDVLVIVGLTVAASFVFEAGVTLGAKLLVYRNLPLIEIGQIPEVLLLAQLLAYVVIFGFMYVLAGSREHSFWQTIRWNWPARWPAFLFGGALLYFALLGLGQLLPIPRHLPIDRFFDTPREAALMSIFAVAFAPLMEELFFRGFLYPVLERRVGALGSILITATAFGAIHGDQLKYSWGAVLIIFLVGVALTTVRAATKSVAASFLLHVGYNGTLSVLLYIASGGFKHLDKLNQ